MDIGIRRIEAHEGALLKEIRLRALGDAPTAFASTYDAEAAHDDRHWAGRAVDGSAGHETATFLALRADAVVGLVVGHHPDPNRRAVELVSMWTAPTVRRNGVARQLVDALVRWADEASADSVELWVTEGNDAAITLYRSAGFQLTGERARLPSDPSLDELRMTRRIR